MKFSTPKNMQTTPKLKQGDSSGAPSQTCSDSSEPVYKYRDDSGDEIEFLPEYQWQVSNPKYFAEAVAEEDYNQSNPDLHDPSDWPRSYEIWWEEKWVSVEVDMDYSPNFSGKIHDQNSLLDNQ